jgi:hypothetical protein
MWKPILKTARSLAAVVLGYAVIVALTTLAFTTWLGGVSYRNSSREVLALAALSAVVSGVAGGYAAARAAGRAPLLHAAGVVGLLIAETTLLLLRRPGKDPLWYDLMGAATLMGACLLGGWLDAWRGQQRAAPPRPA